MTGSDQDRAVRPILTRVVGIVTLVIALALAMALTMGLGIGATASRADAKPPPGTIPNY
jgi:hypothetical protein